MKLTSFAITVLIAHWFIQPVAHAGPQGTILVRELDSVTIDGDVSDWPLENFESVVELPPTPQALEAETVDVQGDHLVFDINQVAFFNGTEAAHLSDGGAGDFGSSTYFAYDADFFYILSVVTDEMLQSDRDTTEVGSQGFRNDGFELFIDAAGDSDDCVAMGATFEDADPNRDDMQITVALNDTFLPDGADADQLGVRQGVERGGNPLLVNADGGEKNGPGGLFRDALDALDGPDIAARRTDDGYVIEQRIPFGFIPEFTSDHPMKYTQFWNDADAPDGPGGANKSWVTWGQQSTVTCEPDEDPPAALFHAGTWAAMEFVPDNPLNNKPGPNISLRSKVNFGQVDIPPTVQELTIPLRNTGITNPLAIENVTVSGANADRFTVVSFPNSLEAKASADIVLSFDSQGVTGPYEAVLDVTNDDADAEDQARQVEIKLSVVDPAGPFAHLKLDEADGTELADSSGNGRGGTVEAGAGSVTLNQDPLAVGKAIAVSGGGSARLEGKPFGLLESFSASLWFQVADAGGQGTLVSRGIGGSPIFAVLQTGSNAAFFVNDGPIFSTEGDLIQEGTTHHLVVTFDNTEGARRAAIFIDGAEAGALADATNLDDLEDDPFWLGSFAGALGFAGTIDDFQYYNRVLTTEEILKLNDSPGEPIRGVEPGGGGGAVPGTLPAVSADDFGGPEVDNGWLYGYRNVDLANPTVDYDPAADFIQFPEDWWTGNTWDEPNADGDNVPWTVIANDNGHPNGDNNGEIHWAIRRWTSPGGPTEITWNVAKQNVNCGNGVTGALHVNGVRVDSATIAGDDGAGIENIVNVELLAGDVVDLILSPFGVDDTNNDGCDGSFFGMSVREGTGVVIEGPLLVELDATDLAAGAITSWENAGGLGGSFAASGDPTVEVIDGVNGVTFDGDGDYFEGPVTTASLEGSSPRSIIAWVYNPELAAEETVISWGKRGGPDGTNMSFNHGFHNNFGAIGHWGGGGPDIGWNPNTQEEGDEPNVLGDAEAGIWTHIAYTQTGSNTKVFTNGKLTNEEAADLDTHVGTAILVAAQREADGVTVTDGLKGSLTIANVRIFEGAISDADILADFDATADKYGRGADPNAPLDILVLGANDAPDAGADANVMAFLEAEFGAARYMNSAATDGSETADVIVMSSTFGSGSVRGKFHNSSVPIVNWEEAVMDSGDGEFGQSLVTMTKSPDTLQMALGDHPIAGALAGTTIDYLTGAAETLGSAELSAGTEAVGTGVGGAVDGLAMLFVTDTGGAVGAGSGVTDAVSPARRVALPMTDATFDSLTDAGKTLFANAILWAAGRDISTGSDALYAQDFDAFANDTIDLGDGSIITSNDGTNSVQDGALRMTEVNVGGSGASFVLPAFDASAGWTATFDFVIDHTDGGNTPADGFSFNYGAIPAGENFGAPAEEGYGEGVPHVSFQIDTWNWNDPAQDAGVGIEVAGVEAAFKEALGEDGANFKPGERVAASATMSWDPANGASFSTIGLVNNADFVNVPTPDFAGDAAHGFSFLARTGGHTETLIIDNLVITAGASPPMGGPIDGLMGYWPEEYVSTSSDHLDLGTLPALTVDSGFTWSFWVNSEETDNNNIVFGNRYMPDGTDFAPREFIKFTPKVFEWHFDGGGENVGGEPTWLPIGVWSHNLVVKDGSTVTYYRDGAEIATGEITGSPVNPQPLYLGGQPGSDGNTTEGFAGTFMEVAVFDRALSVDDVAEVYTRGLNGVSLGSVPTGPGGPPVDVGFGANGAFGFTLPDGVTADIEYSTDLINWEVIATGVSGAVEDGDAGRSAAPAGYYRAQ